MNAPHDPCAPLPGASLTSVSLDDKYTLEHGRVFMSGIQALVRLPMLQQTRDAAAGLSTAGFISGYRGSPLGGLDQALVRAQSHLASHRITFQPGINEDLAATAVWGSQQVNLYPSATYDGVFGMWYGKGPGVDRSGDVLKHANSAGSSPHGGVLVLAGDDHGARSSTLAHQSEHVFKACGIPVLFPADVQEYLDFGLHGWAMSRYSGLWVAMKCVTDVVESSASVDIAPERVRIVTPEDFEMPPGGLNIRWPDPPLDQEARLLDYKWYAALAYVRANRLDRIVIDAPNARFGIVTAGKAYLDVRQALVDLGLTDAICAAIGVRLYKVGCVWPLEAQGAQAFATGLEEILVIEEKRQILEYAIKEELYNWPDGRRPRVFGKFDEKDGAGGEWSVPMGNWLLPAHRELSPALIARAISARLSRFALPDAVRAGMARRIAELDAVTGTAGATAIAPRVPWFCSGCPHNTSTVVPDGSRALAGIGCHYMALWMDRNTSTVSQMGGEGAGWIGQAPFTRDKHVFANLGDGTYFHSGLLAIRAAIAAGVNITYKILYNDAVAMTGGQTVEGNLTVPGLVAQVCAEGAARVVVVTDEPGKYAGVTLSPGVEVHHRRELDAVQRTLRDIPGTTVLVYDQTCATEKRRRRRRGMMAEPARRVVINEAVCEGCGDCSVKSNCLSVEPHDTPFGTKRRINQSSCNKDFSCLDGFCPSFVTIEGGHLRAPAATASDPALAHAPGLASARVPASALRSTAGSAATEASASRSGTSLLPPPPEPVAAPLDNPCRILVAGIGGTGVVTVGALLGMAAHLDGKGVSVLDVTGLAQKGGAVMSHVQIARTPAQLHATRIALAETSVLLGCDAVVAASDEALPRLRAGHTVGFINRAAAPTAAMIHDPDWRFPAEAARQALEMATGGGCTWVDANHLASVLLGDPIYANPLLLGYAWQAGAVPLTRAALHRAMTLNDVASDANIAAFEWGRHAAHDPDALQGLVDRMTVPAGPAKVVTLHTRDGLDALIASRREALYTYQNAAYAQRYLFNVARVRSAEDALTGLPLAARNSLAEAAARNLYKLMAYKDEYEVARLHADPAFMASLRAQFGGDWKLGYYLAIPLLARRDANGHLMKRRYGHWMLYAFRALAALRFLRGGPLDPFGKSRERRVERALIDEYQALLAMLADGLRIDNHALAVELASLPEDIRGYGHVKERNLAGVRERWRDLLARWHAGDDGVKQRVA